MVREHAELKRWLLDRIASECKIEASRIDPDEPFSSYGVESATAAALSGELEQLLGRRLEPTLLFEYPSINVLAAHLTAPPARQEQSQPRADEQAVAIVGMACRFPGCRDLAEYWRLLVSGQDAVSEVPAERWSAAELYDPEPLAPGKMSTRWGGFLDGVDRFDRRYFGVSEAEAIAMDPQQRLLLELAWEALGDAGIVPEALAGSATGVFIGISQSEYGQLQRGDRAGIGGFSGTGGALSIAANRISFRLDARGPSLAVDTACSSSLVAVHQALRSLRAGECTLAIAGGANLLLTPEPTIAFSKAGMMAPDGRCRPFDDAASGYVRGEGVGVVVLKPLADALRDRDPVYAVVLGSAVNHDGRSNGLTAPSPGAQEDVLQAAYRDAGVDPHHVAYVEAHGTGTRLGDPIEATALGRIVGRGRAPGSDCLIGSVKGNIGHLESAAGIAGLIKVALALDAGVLPPSRGYARPNALIPFAELHLQVVTETTPITHNGSPPVAGVSSFGFGGTNCHVVVQAAAVPAPAPRTARSHYLLPLSAPDVDSLTGLAERYARHLQGHGPQLDLADFAHTCAVRRSHQRTRAAVIGRSHAELIDELQRLARREPNAAITHTAGARRVAFVFSGHGTQWARMGLDAMAEFPAFRAVIEQCDVWTQRHVGLSLIAELQRDAADSRLGVTSIAQLAIVSIQLGLVALLRDWGIEPDAVIGHSVGELAAAVAAGALDLERALHIASQRGGAMDATRGAGTMLSVPLAEAAALALAARLEVDVDVAAINAPGSCVLSGAESSLKRVAAELERGGSSVRWLPVDYPFHGRFMVEAADSLQRALVDEPGATPHLSFYSTVTGGLLSGSALDAGYWASNVRNPVRFADAVRAAAADHIEVFVELSSHPALLGAIRDSVAAAGGDAAIVGTLNRELPSTLAMARCLGKLYCEGIDADWSAVHADGGRALRLPHFPWRHERYWIAPARAQRAQPAAPRRNQLLLGQQLVLAGRRTDLAWSALITPDEPSYLGQHIVLGAPVLPAAAYVELGLSALWELEQVSGAVVDLEVHAPLWIDQGGSELQTWLTRDADALRVEVHARPIAGAEFVCHASMRLVRTRGELLHGSSDASIAEIQCRCLEQFPIEAFYDRLQQIGLQYGPTFRGLKDLWRRDGEALGTLQAAPPALAAQTGRIHPARLDALFHTIAAALPGAAMDGPSALYLPVAIGSVEVSDAFLGATKVHAAVRSDADGERVVAQLRALAPDGSVVATIDHLVLRRAQRADVEVAADSETQAIWLYDDVWQPLAEPEPRSADGSAMRLVVMHDRSRHALALCDALQRRGHVLTHVLAGEGFAQLESGSYLLNPQRAEDHVELARRVLSSSQGKYDAIVYLLGLCDEAVADDCGDSVQVAALRICMPLLHLSRALTLNSVSAAPRLWIATRGSQQSDGQEAVEAWQAPLWGLAKGISFEQPELRCTRLDLPAGAELGAASAQRAIAAIERDGDEVELAVRETGTFAPRFVPSTRTLDGSPITLQPDAAYVVSGGLGALGGYVAAWLAACGARHIALFSRNPPPAEMLERFALMQERGVEVRALEVDVSDDVALHDALERVRHEMGPIAGVVHAAGVLDDGAAIGLCSTRMASVFDPKVSGGFNLDRATRGDALDFFVVFSSAAASLGSVGQASYIAANAYLGALSAQRAHEGRPVSCIEWGPWAGAGMAADAASGTGSGKRNAGISMIFPQDGLAVMEALISAAERRAIVLPFDLRSLVHLYPAAAGLSRFERLFGEDLHARRNASVTARVSRRPELDQVFVEARNELEATIAGIWQRALEVDRVGVRDSFFELGGDSVLAGQVVTQINMTLGVTLDSRRAFEAFTVEALSANAEDAIQREVAKLSEDEARALLSGSGG